MVLLQRSAFPLVCGWYVVVVRFVTQRNVHNVSNVLFTTSGLLSMSRKAGIPYGTAQWSKKIDATCGAAVFDDGFA